MKHTENYGLALYELTDKMSITAETDSLNANMKIIDSQLNEMDEQIASNNELITNVSEPIETKELSQNLFNPKILTDAGWTFDENTGEFVGTVYQIRMFYDWIIPFVWVSNQPYLLSFDAYTEGNQGTNGDGLIVRWRYGDDAFNQFMLKNDTTAWKTVKAYTYTDSLSAHGGVQKLIFSYGSNGENRWHLRNVMLTPTAYKEDKDNFVPYEPYGYKISNERTAKDITARKQDIESRKLAYPEWMNKRYFHHIGVSKYTNVIIPSQSLADVSKAKRLGFDVIELNVHKTSDGKYITIHGNQNKFGQQVQLTDGSTTIQNELISSKTYDYIKENVRYASDYEQYRTTIPTLEDMLYECKIHGIHPYIQYADDGVIPIADKILGKGQYILGTYEDDRPDGYDGICMAWLKISNLDDLMKKADKTGGLYSCGLDVTNSAFSSYTDDEWRNLTSALHERGYRVNFAPVYANPPKTQKMYEYGFDLSSSGWEINDFDSGNLKDISSDLTFAEFTHAGTVTDGVLLLPSTKNISPLNGGDIPTVFLGGASLSVRFKGTLHIGLGRYIDHDFVSDGKHEICLTSFFENAKPTFYAKAMSEGLEIYDIRFKASRM